MFDYLFILRAFHLSLINNLLLSIAASSQAGVYFLASLSMPDENQHRNKRVTFYLLLRRQIGIADQNLSGIASYPVHSKLDFFLFPSLIRS